MCGVVGYIGKERETKKIFAALKALEYRGYDSAGLGVRPKGEVKLKLQKAVGNLSHLEKKLKHLPSVSDCVVGHTRWATHGPRTLENAHPHQVGSITFVHNGIFEGASHLKDRLLEMGYEFQSTTDSEVGAAWLDFCWKQDPRPPSEEKFQDVLRTWKKDLEGSYAVLIYQEEWPDCLVAVRQGAPLVVGLLEDEQGFLVASGVQALFQLTSRYVILSDHQTVFLSSKDVKVFQESGERVEHLEVKRSEATSYLLDKGEHSHFLGKEISEHPDAVLKTVSYYLMQEEPFFRGNWFEKIPWAQFESLHIMGCGSSYYAALTALPRLEDVFHFTPLISLASELLQRPAAFQKGVAYLAISQSGETADLIACVKAAQKAEAFVIGLINSAESTLAYLVDFCFHLKAGVEISVASTKVFSASVVALEILALARAVSLHQISKDRLRERVSFLFSLPLYLDRVYESLVSLNWSDLIEQFDCSQNFLILGRSSLYGVALEGALKLKELCYVPSEGYAGGELKHGPLALIGLPRLAVIYCILDNEAGKKMMSTLAEIHSRHQPVNQSLILTTLPEKAFEGQGLVCCLPEPKEMDQGILGCAMWLHYFSLVLARHKGYDIDQPRNLAKSVTVV